MPQKSLLVLGLMSGTSADGVEAALAEISGAPPRLHSKLVGHTSFPFPKAVRTKILEIAEGAHVPAGEISQLNFRLGGLFGDVAIAACKKFGVSLKRLDLIASHGQTVFHQGPSRKVASGGWRVAKNVASTLQLGDGSVIANLAGVATVSDFRPADMAAGGQGAPLVPFADYLLYRDEQVGRVSLNLGGIANVTVIPPGAKPADVFAFDTGPANMVIDALVSHFTKGRQRYDADARLAQRGKCIMPLLEKLLRDPYLRLKPPKSTGREYFGRQFTSKILKEGPRLRARPEDLIRTAAVFTALSVVDALNRFVLPQTKVVQLIVSGGGARNPLLMAQLEAALAPIQVLRSEQFGVPEQSKEAYAFALLGYETWHRRASNLPSATGARRPAVLGKIAYAGSPGE